MRISASTGFEPDGPGARRLGAWFLLGLMLAGTIVIWRHEFDQLQVMKVQRVDSDIRELRRNFERQIEAYLDGLRAARGLFAASLTVERQE